MKLEDNYLMLGDVHGNFDFLKKENLNWKEHYQGIIQVGDMGLGFPNPKFLFEPNVPLYFIRGNHDNLQFILNNNKFNSNVNFIEDGTIKEMNGNVVLFVGGAASIDKGDRIIGIDWWPDEMLSFKEMNEILDKIDLFQKNGGIIDTVVTHDCPTQFKIQNYIQVNLDNSYAMSMRNFLGSVFELLNPKPKQWYFGHYHKSLRIIEEKYKTEFILLPSVENYLK